MTLNPGSETNPADELPTRPRSQRQRPPLFTGEPSPQPEPSPEPTPVDGAGSASGSPDDGKQSRKSPGPRASSVSPSDRRQIKNAIKAGVQLVGVQLHQVAVRDQDEADAGLWLTDEQDQEGIAEPLSSLMARRGGVGVVNPDLGDAIAALIALVTYLSKQLNLRARLRAIRRGQPTDVGAEMNDAATPPAA